MNIEDIDSPCFDFADIYDDAVDRFPSGCKFVEIGVYAGRSTCHMANTIKESGKEFDFWAIDTFRYVSEETVQNTIDQLDLTDQVCLLNGRSQDWASNFFDREFQFVFIDGSHKYTDVMADLMLWWPKICTGGVFSGHDYTDKKYSPDVKTAVDQFFEAQNRRFEVKGTSWWLIK